MEFEPVMYSGYIWNIRVIAKSTTDRRLHHQMTTHGNWMWSQLNAIIWILVLQP